MVVEKQKRDGSATIRRAKLVLAKTEVNQWFKFFLANPEQKNLNQLTYLLKSYQEVATADHSAAALDTTTIIGQAS